MTARIPAHVAPYVEALGEAQAIEFLLAFGGAEIYVAAAPAGRGRVEELVGREGALALARVADRLPARVPTAKPWLAERMASRGLPVAEIARRLHASDVSVRRWLRSAAAARPDPRQPRLF